MTKHILTGGPGVGKSTLLAGLRARGYDTIEESARLVIAEQQLLANPILPQTQLGPFQALVTERQLALEKERYRGNHTFLDRSLVDQFAYMALGNVEPHPELRLHTERAAYSTIFFLERLPSYIGDTARWEDEAYAIKVHNAIRIAYTQRGFSVHDVPVFNAEPSVDGIADNVTRRIACIEDVLGTPLSAASFS